MITYDEFKTKYNWKFLDYDGINAAQCVDLIKGYLDEVFGLWPIGPMGDAKDYIRTVPNKSSSFKHVRWLQGIEKWDIIISTTASAPYGHIAIYESTVGSTVYVFNQNGGPAGNNKPWDECRIQAFKSSYYTDYIKVPVAADKDEIARTIRVIDILEEIKRLSAKLQQLSPTGENPINYDILDRRTRSAKNYFDQL